MTTADLRVHDLLRLDDPVRNLRTSGPFPSWAVTALCVAPWAVVRRGAPGHDGSVPVGVRGTARDERVAATVPRDAVREVLRPEQLALRDAESARCAVVPALAALPAVRRVLDPYGFPWGPGGSIGFELATGHPAARPGSDLDLVLRTDTPLPYDVAARLAGELAALPVRADVRLETPYGALALAEYARGPGPVLLRTVDGARLAADPWQSASLPYDAVSGVANCAVGGAG